MHNLARHDRPSLRPVLFQILCEIEIVNELVHALQAEDQLRRHVHAYVHSFGHQGKLQAELIPEEFELLFLYAFILFYGGLHVAHFLVTEDIVQLIFVARRLIIIITV